MCNIAYILCQTCSKVLNMWLRKTQDYLRLEAMLHICIRDDHAVICTHSFKLTHCTMYGSTYLTSPILTASS